ncbi:MAG: hypothetical protein IJ681_10420 [Bacteroidales bacterium]|nr:hypothetical protein [Bacteroidales bacterium]
MEIKKPLPEKQNSTKQNVKEYHPLQKVYTQKDNKTINDENASQPSVTNKQEYSPSYEQPEYLAQNTVEIIKEVNNLPQDMDTVKIIYVKSKKQPQRNSFFHYVGQRTMNYIQERRQQRQEYTF